MDAIPSQADPPFACPPDDIVLHLPVPISVNRTRKIDWKEHKRVLAWEIAADQVVLMAKRDPNNPLKLHRIKRFELHITLDELICKLDADNTLKTLIDYLRRIEVIEKTSAVALWSDGDDASASGFPSYPSASRRCRSVRATRWRDM
jgi:hypothetical protein